MDDLVFLPSSFAQKLGRFIIKPDDLVITLTGTIGKEDYGNVCFVGNQYGSWFLNQRVAKMEVCTGEITKEFLFWAFRQPALKAKLTQHNRGVRQANISNKDILGLDLPLPPRESQKEFAGRASEMRALQATQAASRVRLDALFQSTLHRAFAGEL